MKTAIIIGATSGIGRQIAICLLEDGWRVGIAGRREHKLMEMKDLYGEDAVAVEQLDITLGAATSSLDTLLGKTGSPDLFLHVAGIGGDESSLDEERELEIVRTHCEGMVRVVAHFMGYVKNNPAYTPGHKACIGIITSVAGTRGMGVSPAYSAPKKCSRPISPPYPNMQGCIESLSVFLTYVRDLWLRISCFPGHQKCL